MQKGILMYILDSDIVVWYLRGEDRIVEAVERTVKPDETGISTITIAEVYKHIFESEISKTENYLKLQVIIPVDQEIAKSAGFYWQKFSKKLKNLSITDCIVAATAKTQNAPLLTLNTRHFPMKDIKVVSPLK